MSDIIDVKAIDSEKAQSLKSVGWVSYILHLIVAVAAVVPGAQMSAEKIGCRGYLASQPFFVAHPHRHLGWRALRCHRPTLVSVGIARHAGLGPYLYLVSLPHRQRHGAYECQSTHD
jgi:hypothetical protein